jgi:hypothetical protein
MIPSNRRILSLVGAAALLMTACSGVKAPAGGGGGGGGTGGGTGPFSIGGTIIGLTGSGLVLQDNGGDDLTITGTGTILFSFKTPVSGLYNVTVKTAPTNPAQTCSVLNASGTAAAKVTNVQVTCGQTVTISGTVSGLLGTGMVLQDNGGDNLTVSGSGNVPFTFATPLASGSTYAVTILTQPSNPAQTCTIINDTGTANSNVSNVQITCPQPTFTIGGTLIGLVNGPGDTVELQNNGGDNLFVTSNNTTFTFPTPVTNNGGYYVTLFAGPTSQTQPCVLFFYKGIATTNVSDVLVDCQHNDWTWKSGPNKANSYGALTVPPVVPAFGNTPGARDYPATWTDGLGRRWLFGGFGLELAGKTPPDTPGLLNDLWAYAPQGDGGWLPANLPVKTTDNLGINVSYPTPTICTLCISTADFSSFQSTGLIGTTGGTQGTGPGGRWGSVTWTDAAGNLWMFGGQGVSTAGTVGLLNDIWEFTPGALDVSVISSTYIGSYVYSGSWTALTNYAVVNQAGTYPATVGSTGYPGARWGAGFCTDTSGNVWMFGGQGYDSTGTGLVLLNDLWKYNIASQTWTWMGPTNSNVGQNNGVYGTQGTALAANAAGPGGRETPGVYADTTGNIWVFGGLGLDSVGTHSSGSSNGSLPSGTTPNGALLNDLWKFNIATGQWTWVSGGGASGVANQNGVYGTQLTGAAGNIPGSRWSSAYWSDTTGNLWLFGGWGYATAQAKSTGFLNDVWEYVPSIGQWVWYKGSNDVNQNGYYPTQIPPVYNVPFNLNTPGGRQGAGFWPPQGYDDYVWVFGGQGYDTSSNSNDLENDFWTYLGYPKYPNQ